MSLSDGGSKLRNQSRMLHQSRIDPAFPQSRVEDINQDITKDLQLRSVQRAHAQFFSELVTEWISADDGANSEGSTPDMESSGFENVGRKEMHEQRKEWESIVFGQKDIDEPAIDAYLSNIFTSGTHTKQAYEMLRRDTRQFSAEFAREVLFLDTSMLKVQIKGVLATDLLNEEKRAILKTFLSNDEVLQEVCDVLNMRFKALASWEWTTENGAIALEQRRQLNGKYRVFMDEDVLDAILVHYIGIKWAVHFRQVFTTFFSGPAWSSQAKKMPLVDRQRREWFLGKDYASGGIQEVRNNTYLRDYFMTQLPEQVNVVPRNAYDDDDDDDERIASDKKSPLEIKHGLLQLVVTETMVARHLYPEVQHTVIRSDFKWFGPSLPHQSIFAVMKFFGVSETWLNFFRKFLHAPLRFAQDGSNGSYQTRSTGVPMSHSLSDTMSEVVLFVMDFAVNTSTGSNLYRLHDDFWFWGPLDVSRTAWREMKAFAATMGIEFNEEKTGSVVFPVVGSTKPEAANKSKAATQVVVPIMTSGLPQGDIRWGFLVLDTTTGRFKIDQSEVDKHIEEAKLQLEATTSIFSYIQAYNAYVSRFFSNNFGKPSLAFGREHVDSMIATVNRIHEALFPNGRVVDHLSSVATKKFGVPVPPDGFWYFPVVNGGMELHNPIVPLVNMRESFKLSPGDFLVRADRMDEQNYVEQETRYNKRGRGYGVDSHSYSLKSTLNMSGNEPFMSRAEFLKHREQTSYNLTIAYRDLLKVPEEVAMEKTDDIAAMLATADTGKRAISSDWYSMNAYWKWVVCVHGKDIVERYGKLQLVDAAQVPLGVVSVMKSSKVRWQG
ncbi:uncharacterized protein AB675_10092 [Cyphellophora attinorum]|uniref:Reverse transcriptase domain-containing protein n=1 Tax=Cyphellophora attinorum TaxID=1664694 RepID=A0A0N1GZT2_9EURO|nr:uncharacterized protein AB675_10092 [Phialophora attinorum]KPI36697.1 hypothetical protein AB675_10092 [Phialophora attinorum]